MSTGDSFGFSSDKIWNSKFLEIHSGTNIPEYDNELHEFLAEKQSIFLRSGEPSPTNKYFKILYDSDIWNTISIYKNIKGSSNVEAFFFCARRCDCNIIHKYLIEIKFINYIISQLEEQLNYHFSKIDSSSPFFFANELQNRVYCNQKIGSITRDFLSMRE